MSFTIIASSLVLLSSQFVYLFLAGRDKTATVKKVFSFANLRTSTLRFFTYTECGQTVKYIIGTRLYGNDSNVTFSRCRSTMWTEKWWIFSKAWVFCNWDDWQVKSKKVKKTYSSFSKKKSPRKIKISKVLPVEFSCHYNSQIYLGNFPKEVFFTFYYFSSRRLDR